MRILFISRELGASELAIVLKQEGCDVKMFVEDEAVVHGLDGIIPKTSNWKAELDWVGKDGLIIFDDTGYGKDQSELRLRGYRVVGGSQEADRIEIDRIVGKQIFEDAGLQSLTTCSFDNLEKAVHFLRSQNSKRWVAKVNGGHISSLCYVGENYDQSDLIGVLRHYHKQGVSHVNLQERVEGVEIGVGRYFNGRDWVGPIEINVEHKSLMPNNVGPKTAEMGTLMWYEANEESRLFQKTLAPMKEYLRSIDFRGDVDVNCIIHNQDLWPLEFTARFGNPATALQIEIHDSPWNEFLGAVADGKSYDLKFKKGYGVVVTIAVPPFPYYVNVEAAETSQGLPVVFRKPLEKDDWQHYGFEEVALHESGTFFVAGNRGCVAHVTGFGDSIDSARTMAYERVSNIVVPKMFYRSDIGLHFLHQEQKMLQEWGWL